MQGRLQEALFEYQATRQIMRRLTQRYPLITQINSETSLSRTTVSAVFGRAWVNRIEDSRTTNKHS
jgi:hypothetical protein